MTGEQMNYLIRRMVMGPVPSVPITKEEYDELRVAKAGVLDVLSLEETFDCVRESYRELELRLSTQPDRESMFSEHVWSRAMDLRLQIRRLLGNLLYASRTYLDMFPQHVAALFGGNSARAIECEKRRKQLHSTRFGYRFMEALRNHAQHRGSPVEGIVLSMTPAGGDGVELIHQPFVEVAGLKSDEKFSQPVLREIDGGIVGVEDGRIPLTPSIREYVQSLSELHETVRTHANESVEVWEQQLNSSVQRYASTTGGSKHAGLAAVKRSGDGPLEEPVFILIDKMTQRRLDLQAKNATG